MRRWRGLKALVHDAIDATTGLVGEGHDAAHRNVRRVTDSLPPIAVPAGAVSETVRLSTVGTLGAVRVVNRVVATLTDVALDAAVAVEPPEGPPIPMRSDMVGTAEWVADAAIGALNGAVGHHLAATRNGLDLGLALRLGDAYVDPQAPQPVSGPVVVFVHGLGTTEWSFCLDAAAYHGDPSATFGALLARDLGVVPIYARYNTGRRVHENGRALADALERLYLAGGLERVVLLGHSMGGLVARAACHAAEQAGHRWVDAVDLVISLGTPHQGAPFARFGQRVTDGLGAVDLPATRVLASILAGRSAGIRDLEHGDLTDLGPDPDATSADRVVPLRDGVTYAFLSATMQGDPEGPASRWLGDLLVQVGSASGPVQHRAFTIRTATFGGVLHHQIQCHPDVYAQVRALVGG